MAYQWPGVISGKWVLETASSFYDNKDRTNSQPKIEGYANLEACKQNLEIYERRILTADGIEHEEEYSRNVG